MLAARSANKIKTMGMPSSYTVECSGIHCISLVGDILDIVGPHDITK